MCRGVFISDFISGYKQNARSQHLPAAQCKKPGVSIANDLISQLLIRNNQSPRETNFVGNQILTPRNDQQIRDTNNIIVIYRASIKIRARRDSHDDVICETSSRTDFIFNKRR